MRDQLPARPWKLETGIINLDKSTNSGTHWVAYAIDPRGIVYFDSYGLPPPEEFLKYVQKFINEFPNFPLWYSTLPTQKINDPPICGHEVINVLDAISKSSLPPHKVVADYTQQNWKNREFPN